MSLATTIDIEVPFRGRRDDAWETDVDRQGQGRRLHGAWSVLPYPVGELLMAPPGPFDLEVEVKYDDRIVGSWCIECHPGDSAGLHVSYARAELYVCGSASGNPREAGAFLAIDSWWVDADDPKQLEVLYGCLSTDTLERLSSLFCDIPQGHVSAPESLVLHLLDVRRRDRRLLALDVLEATLLLDLADGLGIAGVNLKVVHGRGVATTPSSDFESALKMEPTFGFSDSREQRGKALMREALPPGDAKWNRRASDKPRAATRQVDPELTVTSWPGRPE